MSPDAVYLPEIHDHAPLIGAASEDLVALFPPAARPLIAHSIVPDWQGAWPLDAHLDYVARLQALGGQVVLHGFTHSLGEDWMNKLLYGHDNRSEFARLSMADAARRLDAGIAMFSRVFGQAPRWFCSPRWQDGTHLPALLAARRFEGWLGRHAIHRIGQSAIPLPPLNFDEGPLRWRELAGLALRRGVIRRIFATRRPFRMVLHPDDLTRPDTLRQIRQVMDLLESEGWQPLSLAGMIAASNRPKTGCAG
jgi:predicted deacetylase